MLEVKNITKVFPGVRALSDVTCQFKEGEIHALLGENGAGKSTLMKVICGIYKQNEGEIFVDGEKAEFRKFEDALAHHISIVNQEIQVIPLASVAENIMLDKLKKYTDKLGRLHWKKLRADTKKYMDLLKLDMDPSTPAGGLSPAQKQMIAIAKALSSDAKYLVLDEPTSSLTLKEAGILFDRLRELKEAGVGLIFISHKLEEVIELCDVLTVLRDGKVTGSASVKGITKAEIIEMMIGRKTNDEYLGPLINIDSLPTLEVENLNQWPRFENVSFKAHAGEILGFYGLVGAGRTELCRAVIGDTKVDNAKIRIKGKEIKIKSFVDAVNKYGIGYVSENRKEEGLILSFDILQNISITILNQLTLGKFGPINIKKEKENVQDAVDTLDIKTPTLTQLALNLSGGNQQKVSIAKWLARKCDILFIDEPTVGVDVGAKEQIHKLIWELAKDYHKTIILISSDMPEMIKLARRILVFRENKIVAELNDINVPFPGPSTEDIAARIGEYLLA
jgi:ribose transport system ATP-binding protein